MTARSLVLESGFGLAMGLLLILHIRGVKPPLAQDYPLVANLSSSTTQQNMEQGKAKSGRYGSVWLFVAPRHLPCYRNVTEKPYVTHSITP
jgi:hypothetical protein